LEGLEVSVIPSRLLNDEFRFEAQFFRKRFLHDDDALARNEIVALGTFANVTDGPHGYHEVDEDSPIAMLTARSASDWFADRSAADTIAEWVDKANRRSSLEAGDLILASRGTVGNCAIVIPECLPANIDQDVGRISFKEDPPVNPEYLNAYLNCTFGQDHIHRQASGMVQQGISLAKIRAIPVPIFSSGFQDSVRDCTLEALALRRQSAASTEEAEATLLAALGLAGWSPPEPLSYTARAADALTAARLDAQYFMPSKLQMIDALAAMPGDVLGARFKSVRDMFDPSRADPDLLVRNFDLPDALEPILDDEKELVATEDVGSLKKTMRNGDVAMSRLRAYLKETAVVRTSDAHPTVGSSEYIVLRPLDPKANRIAPETLMIFLRSAPVQTILKWCQDGSQHPRFSERDLLAIPVPDAVADASAEIEAMVQSAFAARARSRALLTSAKRAVEIAIEDSEAAALAWLAR
jgi:type I restriction enzyme, S subunit